MDAYAHLQTIPNWINGIEKECRSGDSILKYSPVNGAVLYKIAQSNDVDVHDAVEAASAAFQDWSTRSPVERGDILFQMANLMQEQSNQLAEVVARETGKNLRDAEAEVSAAIAQARFMAAEGQRLYGHTTTSADKNKMAMTLRSPIGIAGLIVAANTPIANLAWKIFPALICGNSVVLKAAEDTPMIAWYMAKISKQAGLPDGVLNIIQGSGSSAGEPIISHKDVAVISFTGSTQVGRRIATIAGERMAKISLELGGKNPLVVCDDADLDNAVRWTILSAFSNAGQRCAAASRIIVFDGVYDSFKSRLLAAVKEIQVGSNNNSDFGPVINERQMKNILAVVDKAVLRGATLLAGGKRMLQANLKDGFYLAPTVLDEVDMDEEISQTEIFGPVTCLYRARDFEHAVQLCNESQYGLTAAIHTQDINRAMEFCRRVEAGSVSVNAGTHGSEPHMPFGGVKQSGNGSREPGTAALDVYSELKNVYVNLDAKRL